jgi:TRAP-type C4-dicarboxylate transport system permease small subunit
LSDDERNEISGLSTKTGYSLIRRLALWPAWISCGLLVLLMLLTATDVALRYLFSAPIYGGLEISESLMVALIMLSMAYCGASDGHVRVDVLDGALGRMGRRICDVLTGAVSTVVLWFLVRRTWTKTLDTYEYNDVTNFLEMPLWPLYAIIVVGMGSYAAVIVLQVFSAITGIGYERD